jgi:hypothetical protein
VGVGIREVMINIYIDIDRSRGGRGEGRRIGLMRK